MGVNTRSPAPDPAYRGDLPRLRRLLGGPELAWLVARVRRRMERGEQLTGTVSLPAADEAQRAAVEQLLGRAPRPGRSLALSLTAVDEVLRRSGVSPGGLAPAVTALTGPVVPLQDTARREAEAWEEAYAPVAALCAERPELAPWYERLRATGLVRRLASGDPATAGPLLADLAVVVRGLPAPTTGLGNYAALNCRGDAHALDDDRPLATLTLGAVRALTGAPAGEGAEWRRETWARVGLLKDELSSTVLVLGLPGDSDTATGRALAALREAGQPVVLTLRQLLRDPPDFRSGPVRVCENPSVVAAAADRLGAECPSLVCTQGQPGAAAITLLRGLADGGADLHYHGDFDWGGLRTANALLRRVPWQPWRYTSADYLAATRRFSTHALTGAPATADWDPDLAPAMTAGGLRIEEELVLDDLLDDLSAPGRGGTGTGRVPSAGQPSP